MPRSRTGTLTSRAPSRRPAFHRRETVHGLRDRNYARSVVAGVTPPATANHKERVDFTVGERICELSWHEQWLPIAAELPAGESITCRASSASLAWASSASSFRFEPGTSGASCRPPQAPFRCLSLAHPSEQRLCPACSRCLEQRGEPRLRRVVLCRGSNRTRRVPGSAATGRQRGAAPPVERGAAVARAGRGRHMFGQLPEWCVLVDGVVVVEVLFDCVVVVEVLVDGVVVELPLAALAIAAPPPIAAPARDRATRATRIGCRMAGHLLRR
jgi:hypothetical protein